MATVNNKKKTTKTTRSKISTNKKVIQSKKASSNSTAKKQNIRFSVPMVEIKPISAENVKYSYAYKNDLENYKKEQISNQINDEVKKQINEIEEIDNKMIAELNLKINDLNEKNKQWQSKYDHLNSEYQSFKKNVELEKINNQNQQNDSPQKKHSFFNRKKEEQQQSTVNDNNYRDDNNQQINKSIDELNLKNKQLNDEINNLNLKLEAERQKMVEKIQEKSIEAQKIVNEKIANLEVEKQKEIASNKLKVFESTINSFLDPYIILKNTLNSINNPQINNYLQGFRMINDMIKDNLTNLGVKEILVNIGDMFDENYMLAFDVVDDPNFSHNQVVRIVNPGFVFDLNNEQKVLKYVSVIVAK